MSRQTAGLLAAMRVKSRNPGPPSDRSSRPAGWRATALKTATATLLQSLEDVDRADPAYKGYEGETMRIVLADEISPDSCRLWDIKTRNKLDKDRFRQDLGGVVEAYREVAQRLGILVENDNALTTGPRLVQ